MLTAFTQVDTDLVNYTQEHATLAALTTDVQQAQIALGLAEDQYKEGLADYLQVLDAQQSYLQAQQSQAQAVASLSGDLVTLYQALGGGWQQTFPAPDIAGAPSPIATVAATPSASPAPGPLPWPLPSPLEP